MTNGKTTFEIQGLVSVFVPWFSKMLLHETVVLDKTGYRLEH